MTALLVRPAARTLVGTARIPGDKSIGHRALLFSCLSESPVRVRGLGDGADNGRSARAITALGARIDAGSQPGEWIIHGTGLGGMRAPQTRIDCGNSGTTIRLLCGLVAGQPFATELFGDESLSERPMRRVIDPLRQMGVVMSGRGEGYDLMPPLVVGPSPRPLTAIHYRQPVASAQVKSAILLAGLYADGETTVEEPGPGRDHTERLLAHMGAPIAIEPAGAGRSIRIGRTGWDRRLHTEAIDVPGDPSSSAFLAVAVAVIGGEVRMPGIAINPTRLGYVDVLRAMGVDVRVEPESVTGGEPVGTLVVTAVAKQELRAGRIDGDLTLRALDEIPILAVAAARAEGTTYVGDAMELRVKESDRIATTVSMLRSFGVEAEASASGLHVVGQGARPLRAGRVDAAGDHRIAMAGAVAALLADGPSRIDDAGNIATSYPGFVAALTALGADVEVV